MNTHTTPTRRSNTSMLAALVCVSSFWLMSVLPATAQSWATPFKDAPDSAQWAWAQAPWDANDKPFVAIRKRIDAAVAKGQKPEVLARRFKAQAQVSAPGAPQFKIFKRDAKAQFAFGYSSYLASQALIYNSERSQMALSNVPEALERPAFPRSYQYARLMFLVMSKHPSDERLRWAGERLVQRNPKDYAAKRGLARTLLYTTLLRKQEKMQALSLINSVLKANPKDAATQSTKGFFYYMTSKQSKDPAEVQKAIDGYRAYLALAPKNADFRPKARSYIAELEKRKKEFGG